MSESAKKYLDRELGIKSRVFIICSESALDEPNVKRITAMDMAQLLEDYANSKT